MTFPPSDPLSGLPPIVDFDPESRGKFKLQELFEATFTIIRDNGDSCAIAFSESYEITDIKKLELFFSSGEN
jgi:hypothetical protein